MLRSYWPITGYLLKKHINCIILIEHIALHTVSFLSSRTGKFSFWEAVSDPHVRAGIYLWLIIAGLCVFLANAVAMGA